MAKLYGLFSKLSGINKTIGTIVLLLLLVAVLLYGAATQYISNFQNSHVELAENAVMHTGQLIGFHLEKKRRDVDVYVKQFKGEIKYLANNPYDEPTQQLLIQSLKEHFPDAVTYTIANSDGDVLLNDNEGLVGNGCRQNIRLFAINSEQSDAAVRIHSDKYEYHFDIMNELQLNDGRIIIYFVSFKPEMIASYLEHVQPANHELFIIKHDSDYLIEISAVGARVKLMRADKHLTIEERQRMLASYKIQNTQWDVVDVIHAGVLEEDNQKILHVALYTFMAFVFLGVLFILVTSRHYREKIELERLLAEKTKV